MRNSNPNNTTDKTNCYPEAHAIVSFILELNMKNESFTQTQLCDFLRGSHKKL